MLSIHLIQPNSILLGGEMTECIMLVSVLSTVRCSRGLQPISMVAKSVYNRDGEARVTGLHFLLMLRHQDRESNSQQSCASSSDWAMRPPQEWNDLREEVNSIRYLQEAEGRGAEREKRGPNFFAALALLFCSSCHRCRKKMQPFNFVLIC